MKRIAASLVALLLLAWCAASAAIGADQITIDPIAPKQGQTLVVRVSLPDVTAAPDVRFNGKVYKLFSTGRGYRALIGVPADLRPGTYKLSVGAEERAIQVKAGSFPIQRIRLPKDKDNFISSPGEEETVNAAKQMVSPVQWWAGKFERPSKARTSSAFGLRRMVNGKLLKDYLHSGLDYAGAYGSPVVATQRGHVIIATKKPWRLHGNTVAIDHGQGVVSFYIHLSKVSVEQGAIVEPGQLIGKIGATGRASGPHLHFSLYVSGNATSPSEWYARDI